jgi:hypothetical protein
MKIRRQEIPSLMQALKTVGDPRSRRGIRHSKTTLLAISVVAVLSGARSLEAIAQWGRQCTQSELRRLGCRRNPRNGKLEAPSEPTLRRFLQSIDAECVDRVVGQWLAGLRLEAEDAIAIDGKTVRGARRADRTQVHLLSAVLQSSGITIAQVEVDSKSNEIPAAYTLLKPLPLGGKLVTADALHTQRELARFIVEDMHADYCFTVKDNQPTLKADIDLLFDGVSIPPSAPNA